MLPSITWCNVATLIALILHVAADASGYGSPERDSHGLNTQLDDEGALLQVHMERHIQSMSESGRRNIGESVRRLFHAAGSEGESLSMETNANSQAHANSSLKRCDSTSECWPSTQEWRILDASIQGRLLLPSDKSFNTTTELYNKRLDIIPGAVALPASIEDVQAVVKFAKTRELKLSIKSLGGSVIGNCMANGSLNIDLSNLKDMSVDTEAMEMFVSPGNSFKELYAKCDSSGVVFPGTLYLDSGVSCLLGGCYGPLMRRYGLGSDNLIGVVLITADGALVTADMTRNADLFWALRGGGGGSFGVVVGMLLRVHPAPHHMVRVSCVWPLVQNQTRVAEPVMVDLFEKVLPTMPDAWMFFIVMNRNADVVPAVKDKWDESMGGILRVEGLYANSSEADNASLSAIGALLELGKTALMQCHMNKVANVLAWNGETFTSSKGIKIEGAGRQEPSKFRTYTSSSFAQTDIDYKEHAKFLVDTMVSMPPADGPLFFASLFGGKVARPDFDSAVPQNFRGALFMQEIVSFWLDPLEDDFRTEFAQQLGGKLANLKGFRGSYVSYPDPTQGKGTYEQTLWGEKFASLQKVKRKWDPRSLFECEQCVHN